MVLEARNQCAIRNMIEKPYYFRKNILHATGTKASKLFWQTDPIEQKIVRRMLLVYQKSTER